MKSTRMFSVVPLVLFGFACSVAPKAPQQTTESSGATAAAPSRVASPAAASQKPQSAVERGGFLVRMGGCNDCHTPMKFDPEIGMPVPQMDRYLSGHPQGAPGPAGVPKGNDQAVIGPTFTSFRLPFGTVFTANLTPDANTGLGAWTEDMFVRAMRTGRHMGGNGRPIVPPMPWPVLNQQSEEDLKAIFAYLKSIPAIKNEVPQPQIPDQVLDGLAASYDKLLTTMKPPAPADLASR